MRRSPLTRFALLATMLGAAAPVLTGCDDKKTVDPLSDASVQRATTPTTPTADPNADTAMAGGRKTVIDAGAAGEAGTGGED
jgi:hypothetical protein